MVSRAGTFLGLRRHRPTSEVRSELNTLRRDLLKVRADIGDLANALCDAGRGSADAARGQFNNRLKRLNQAYRMARQRGDEVRESVTQRPVASVAGAFAAGLVLAAIVMMLGMMRR